MPNETAVAEPPLEAPIPPEAAAELDKIALDVFKLHNDSPDAPPVEPAETSTAPQKAAAPESAPSAAATPLKAEPMAVEPSGIPLDLLLPKEDSPAAPAPEPEIEIPKEIKTEAGIKNWKDMRTRYDEAKRTIQTLETKLKQQPAADPNAQALIEQLRTQNQEYARQFERVNLEASPRFQQQFTRPIETASEHARTLLKNVNLEPELFDRTMTLPPNSKARIEALDDLMESIQSPSVKAQVLNTVAHIDGLDAQRREVLSDVKGRTAREIQDQRAQQAVQAQEEEKRLAGVLDQTITHLRDKSGFEFLKKSQAPGSEEWNKTVDSIVATAGDILLRNTDETQAAAAATLGAMAPHLHAALHKLRAAYLEQAKELAAIKGAEPGLERGGSAIVYDDAPVTSVDELVKMFTPRQFGAG